MSLAQFLILQLIAHLLADFILQTNSGAKDKDKDGFRSGYLKKKHIPAVFIVTWLLSFQISFIYGALVISFIHFLVDGMKTKMLKKERIKKYAFFIDQLVHLITIVTVVLLFDKYCGINPLFHLPISTKYLLLIAGYIFCTKPANIIIDRIIKGFEIESPGGDDDLPNAGRLIGDVERFLVLTFIILNQYEAVGFLIAAKSILRFDSSATKKTEYVLIGTMLSFAIAITSGIIIIYYEEWSRFLILMF